MELPASGAFEVFCRSSGSGPWLTFLHAFPTSSWDWAKVAPALEPRFRLLCFDFLGFGDSDKPRGHRYSIFEQADLCEALWRRLGVEETGVIAHDYGATVALELAARHEEGRALAARISKLVLLNGALYNQLARPLLVQRLLTAPLLGPLVARTVTKRVFVRSLASVLSARDQVPDSELHEHWHALRRRGGTVAVAPQLARFLVERRLHAARWEGALERSGIPVVCLWGMADPRSGAPVVEHLRRRLPEASVVAFEDVGHYPQLEASDRVAEEIAAAFRLPRRGRPARPPRG